MMGMGMGGGMMGQGMGGGMMGQGGMMNQGGRRGKQSMMQGHGSSANMEITAQMQKDTVKNAERAAQQTVRKEVSKLKHL